MHRKSRSAISAHLKEQIKLLEYAQDYGEPLPDVLDSAGWSYDDLIYKNSKLKEWKGGPPRILDDFRSRDRHAPYVSFFSGCGGMDLGMEAAGFQQIGAFEINELFCKTLRRNRPKWKIFGPPVHSGNVSKFEEVARILGQYLRTPFDGLFVGGPPCQPFSIAANQRFSKIGANFKRVGFSHEQNGNLFFDFLHLIIYFKPAAFIVENVPGLRDLDGGKQLSVALQELKANDYRISDPIVLDASRFEVPQQRQRLFLIGSRIKSRFIYPVESLLSFGAGSVLNENNPTLPNHETRDHKAGSILRYMGLDYGQREQLGRVDRLDPTVPSKTVIAGGTNGGGRSHLHPEIPRTLTVRECARLQTFPDEYVFLGSPARQFTQVGNAVPPVLAAQIGHSVRKAFF